MMLSINANGVELLFQAMRNKDGPEGLGFESRRAARPFGIFDLDNNGLSGARYFCHLTQPCRRRGGPHAGTSTLYLNVFLYRCGMQRPYIIGSTSQVKNYSFRCNFTSLET